MLGISGFFREDLIENGLDVNFFVLAKVTIVRVRNIKAFVVYYRISIIMFYSGVKYDDLIRLNRLGVCMFLDVIVIM